MGASGVLLRAEDAVADVGADYSEGYSASASWCDRCSARFVRFTGDGRALCRYHWFDSVLTGWAVRCSDGWFGRQVLETLLRAARPLDEARIVELVAWHPLRQVAPAERALRLPVYADGVRTALAELLALDVVRCTGAAYCWSESGREQIHG